MKKQIWLNHNSIIMTIEQKKDNIEKLEKGLKNQQVPESVKAKMQKAIDQLKKEVEAAEQKSILPKPKKPKAAQVPSAKKTEKKTSSPKPAAKKQIQTKTVKSTGETLLDILKNDPYYKKFDFSKTNVVPDSKRRAQKPGKRTSDSGNRYYESRENRSDHRTTGKIFLEHGGELLNMDPMIVHYNVHYMYEDGGPVTGKYELLRMMPMTEAREKYDAGHPVLVRVGSGSIYDTENHRTIQRIDDDDRTFDDRVNTLDMQHDSYDFLDRTHHEVAMPDMKADFFRAGGRAKSALMRDRKYVNSSQDYETIYAKGKNRPAYKKQGGEVAKLVVVMIGGGKHRMAKADNYRKAKKSVRQFIRSGQIKENDFRGAAVFIDDVPVAWISYDGKAWQDPIGVRSNEIIIDGEGNIKQVKKRRGNYRASATKKPGSDIFSRAKEIQKEKNIPYRDAIQLAKAKK